MDGWRDPFFWIRSSLEGVGWGVRGGGGGVGRWIVLVLLFVFVFVFGRRGDGPVEGS